MIRNSFTAHTGRLLRNSLLFVSNVLARPIEAKGKHISAEALSAQSYDKQIVASYPWGDGNTLEITKLVKRTPPTRFLTERESRPFFAKAPARKHDLHRVLQNGPRNYTRPARRLGRGGFNY